MDSNTTNTPLIDHAINFASRGWAIIPLHHADAGECSCRKKKACGQPGKHPRQSGWTRKASTDIGQIRKWWKQWPAANIGIVTGQPSDVVVVDVDAKSGGLETLDELFADYPELNSTYSVRTGGGGWHFYFGRPAAALKNRVGALPGIDLRAENGCVVAAGSIHVSGARYAVFRDRPVVPLPAGLCRIFGVCEEWTQEQHRNNAGATQEQRKQERQHQERGSVLDLSALAPEQQKKIREAITNSIPDKPGRRNRHVFELGRRLMAIDGITSGIDPESFRPVVRHFHTQLMINAATKGFDVSGTFAQTMDDFRYAWPRIHTPMDETMAGIIESCREVLRGTLPEPVRECITSLGYDDDRDTIALVALLWFLSRHWGDGRFFLSARAGESALKEIGTTQERSFQWVNRSMRHLQNDRVIECVERSKPGQRGVASVYTWIWTPSSPTQPLDWLV